MKGRLLEGHPVEVIPMARVKERVSVCKGRDEHDFSKEGHNCPRATIVQTRVSQ